MSRASPRFKRVSASLPPIGQAQGAVVYKILGNVEGQLTVSTFGYFGPNFSPTQTQLNTLFTGISTNVYSLYKACLSASWQCIGEQLAVVHRNDIITQHLTTNIGTTGSRGSPAAPTQIAAVILRSTNVKGQHGRGRLSLPAISEVDITASHISAASLNTAITALCAGMFASTSDGSNVWVPGILQRSVVSPRLVVGAAQLVTCFGTTLLGTIRKRKIGRGK